MMSIGGSPVLRSWQRTIEDNDSARIGLAPAYMIMHGPSF